MTEFAPGDQFIFEFDMQHELYAGFRNTFKDNNPLHTNALFARQHGFKDEVMYGNILNGILSFLIGEMLPIKNVVIHSQSIQYKNAVYLHDKLKLVAEVNEVFDSVGAVELSFRFNNVSQQNLAAKGKVQIGILTAQNL